MPHTLTPPAIANPKRRRLAPDALLYATVLFLWMSVWRFQELWPILGKLQVSILLEVVLLVMVIASLSSSRTIRWVKSPVFYIPFLLLGLMIVGVPTNLWPGQAVNFIMKDFGPTLLLYTAVSVSVRESGDLDWLAFAHLVGAAVYSAWIYLYVPVGANARLGGLVYYDANDFGLLIVCTIPFAVYFARPGVVFWKRLFAVASLALFVVMLIKTGSRGGFMAFIGVMAFILVAFRSIPATLRIGAVAGGFLLLFAMGSAAYWEMMSTMLHPKDDYNMTGDVGRKAIWHRGVGYMVTHPLVGVGVRAFGTAEGTISSIAKEFAAEDRGLKWSTAHNSFVLVGAELGIGGLILFTAMIGGSFKRLSDLAKASRTSDLITDDDAAFAQTLSASLVGFCIAGFFVSATYFPYLYVIIGLVVAQRGVMRLRFARAAKSHGKAGAPAATAPVRSRHSPEVPEPHWAPTG